MADTEERIKSDIKTYIVECGGSYSDWYVGISGNARGRLFEGHGVDENNDLWIYRQAYSSDAARRVESYFVSILGTDGGTGGGDEDSDYVYAYKKNEHTQP